MCAIITLNQTCRTHMKSFSGCYLNQQHFYRFWSPKMGWVFSPQADRLTFYHNQVSMLSSIVMRSLCILCPILHQIRLIWGSHVINKLLYDACFLCGTFAWDDGSLRYCWNLQTNPGYDIETCVERGGRVGGANAVVPSPFPEPLGCPGTWSCTIQTVCLLIKFYLSYLYFISYKVFCHMSCWRILQQRKR